MPAEHFLKKMGVRVRLSGQPGSQLLDGIRPDKSIPVSVNGQTVRFSLGDETFTDTLLPYEPEQHK